jgi:hypothetical protein
MTEIPNFQPEINLDLPDKCRENPQRSAEEMMYLLGLNYGCHNLSNDNSVLIEQVRSGKLQPFIQRDKMGKAIACAALIQISENEVEIGRGACIPKMPVSGATSIMIAADYWKNRLSFPESKILKAEVRCAKATKEVPGGQATQTICLNKIGLVPTGFGPFFHHGIPDRQEHFLLASIIRPRDYLIDWNQQEHILPANIFSSLDENFVFRKFWNKFFGQTATICPSILRPPKNTKMKMVFTSQNQGPLTILEPNGTLNSESSNIPNFDNNHRFMVARIDADLDFHISAIGFDTLKNNGFRLIGFEPKIVDEKLKVDILMGRLSQEGKQQLVLPSFIENVFNHDLEDSLTALSINWRSQQ